jgi:hypothetical protein
MTNIYSYLNSDKNSRLEKVPCRFVFYWPTGFFLAICQFFMDTKLVQVLTFGQQKFLFCNQHKILWTMKKKNWYVAHKTTWLQNKYFCCPKTRTWTSFVSLKNWQMAKKGHLYASRSNVGQWPTKRQGTFSSVEFLSEFKYEYMFVILTSNMARKSHLILKLLAFFKVLIFWTPYRSQATPNFWHSLEYYLISAQKLKFEGVHL